MTLLNAVILITAAVDNATSKADDDGDDYEVDADYVDDNDAMMTMEEMRTCYLMSMLKMKTYDENNDDNDDEDDNDDIGFARHLLCPAPTRGPSTSFNIPPPPPNQKFWNRPWLIRFVFTR
ncbi:hypothetical protein DPMN_092138 [Dreissena polymorpha]|uniref:Uncharacterized protein n=1 Tax=Dreissena polymorpha TaxID=45954 RepID=A0A9D4R1D5_DREPO|nr:hypothetical protein DPMN_092138 [Dreissena polymorpha]